MVKLTINGETRTLDVPDEMPLLWALRNELGMVGTKFGCGMGLCGACTVHVDGVATRSCSAPVGSLAGKKIVPPSAGTFPTTGPLWVGLLVGVILIMGGLTYFPAVALGPIVEHFAMNAGNLF